MAAQKLSDLAQKLDTVDSIDSMRGIEGAAATIYFHNLIRYWIQMILYLIYEVGDHLRMRSMQCYHLYIHYLRERCSQLWKP